MPSSQKSVFVSKKGQFSLLAAGVILMFLTRERWSVHLLAWMAPVPFLIFVKNGKGWRHGLLFLGVYCLASVFGCAKSFCPPWPRFMSFVFGIPLGLMMGAGFLLWQRLQQSIAPWLCNLAFPALMVSIEWIIYTFTPLGSVGAMANTQVDNLPFLQLLSVAGVGGVGFVIYWFAAIVSQVVDQKGSEKRIPRYQVLAVTAVIVLSHIFGAVRIGTHTQARNAQMATIQTDFDWFATPEIPPREARLKVTDTLFKRTETAALKGAQMVVWNEISNMIDPEDERALIGRATALCRKQQFHLVLSYLKLISYAPLRWENKYVWLNPDGEIVDTYLKLKPAIPVEPAIPGEGTPKVADTGFGYGAGAICFDFDFPQIGRALANGGVDFAFVPGADSPSIDPYHTQIAAMRAIEGGYSVIRSARDGMSAGIDPFGRITGRQSANESDEKIMLISIPTQKVWTVYKTVGDVVIWLSLLFLAGVVARVFWLRMRGGV